MNIFMQASRLGLTFAHKGTITVSDLWKLSIPSLDTLAQSLHAQIEATPSKSFIKENTVNPVNSAVQLRFDIVIAVLNTLVEERNAKQNAAVVSSQKAELDALIAAAEGKELASKPVSELKAMRDKLGA